MGCPCRRIIESFLHILNLWAGAAACSVCQADLTRAPRHIELLTISILKGVAQDTLERMVSGTFLALVYGTSSDPCLLVFTLALTLSCSCSLPPSFPPSLLLPPVMS